MGKYRVMYKVPVYGATRKSATHVAPYALYTKREYYSLFVIHIWVNYIIFHDALT